MVMSIYLTLSLTLERYLSIVYPLLTLSLRYGKFVFSHFYENTLCVRLRIFTIILEKILPKD